MNEELKELKEIYDSLTAEERAAVCAVLDGLTKLEDPARDKMTQFLLWAVDYAEKHGPSYATDCLLIMARAATGNKGAWDVIDATLQAETTTETRQ